MSRAEVLIEPALGEGLLVTVERAPAEVLRNREPLPRDPDAALLARLQQEPLPEGAAKEAGEALYRWLEGAEGPRQLLALLRAIARHQPACPLFLELRAPEPKVLPWELLRDPANGFLALDDRWPVCRRVNPVVARSRTDQLLEPPLRLAAVLSAAGIDAGGEWQSLRKAVAAVDAARLPVRLLVIVGQPELVPRVKADLAALAGGSGEAADGEAENGAAGADGGGAEAGPEAGAAPLRHGGRVLTVTSSTELQGHLGDFRPHLLHFFCHGTSDHGGLLHLARPSDFVTGHPLGSVVLGREDFGTLAGGGDDTWLVTLNACDSGRPGGDGSYGGRSGGTDALTESIATAGFPAVVGMREPVRHGDAHVFAGALYRDLLRQLGERATEAAAGYSGDGNGDPPAYRELDFASLLLEPRRALAEHHADGLPLREAAAHRKEWSLPVLFVRPEPLRIAVRPPRQREGLPLEELTRLRAKLDTLVQIRQALAASPDTPPEKLARLDEAIEDLTRQLLAA